MRAWTIFTKSSQNLLGNTKKDKSLQWLVPTVNTILELKEYRNLNTTLKSFKPQWDPSDRSTAPISSPKKMQAAGPYITPF